MADPSYAPPAFSARQDQLLAAAVRVVGHAGLRGLTHRAVDSEAGLPQGSTSAYMRTRLALLTRLTEYVAAHFAADLAELTGRIEEHLDVEGYAAQQTSAMLRSWLQHPELLLVRTELTLEGSRQPAVAKITLAQSERLVAIVEHALLSAGTEQAQARLRAVTLTASIDGVLLRALREPPERRTDVLGACVELLMGTLVGPTAQTPGHPTV